MRRLFGFSGKGLLYASGVWLCITQLPAAVDAAQPDRSCAPSEGLTFVCGLKHPEDLVQVPETRWIIASSLSLRAGVGVGGDLYLIDNHRRTWTTMAVRPALTGRSDPEFKDCPGPPDANLFGAHGLALASGKNAVHHLYAVNHGGRESVEVFDLDVRHGQPKLRWTGCVVFPLNLFLNSVAPTADGGFVVTSMVDRSDPDRWKKMAKGENTGVVYQWRPFEHPKIVPGSHASGDNGIVTSPNGDIYIAAWGGKAILRLRWNGGQLTRETTAVDFLPDNLRWAPDGTLLVAGQRRDIRNFFATCTPAPCRFAWVVARLDPRTMSVTKLKEGDGEVFSEATTALQVGDDIWIGSASDDRVAILPVRRSY